MKRILVTGGAGFIGSNFILHMLDSHPDIEIVNLDKLTYAGNLNNLKSAESDSRYTFIQGDICNKKIVSRAAKNCDTIVHFAAESHVDRSITGPAIFIKTNVVGTQVLLDVARENKVERFHHVSTDEVFGSLKLDANDKFSENTSYNPHSPYSASKAASDHLVRAYHDTYDLPITISNCTNNYGPYHFPEKVIPLFITNALQNKPLPIYGSGKAIRDYLFVADHCLAIDLILQKGRRGETYCIGGDSEKNGTEVAETILKHLGKSPSLKVFVEDRKGHDMRYAIDHSKITNEMGWRPTVNFDRGIKKTIEWYLKNQSWWQNIASGKYLDQNRQLMNLDKTLKNHN
jgi:dTDP-glucose 4,6-dehydratase